MASQGSLDPPLRGERGVDLQTLVITALASAAAAFVASKLWAPGTLFSAAMTPVVVALIKEALRKPAQVVTQVVPQRGRTGETTQAHDLPGAPPPGPDVGTPPVHPPPVPGAPSGPVRVYTTRGRRLRWRLALLTGVLGFVVCAVAFTVPELIAGDSVGRPGHGTTLWGGKQRKNSTSTTTTTTGATTTGATTTTDTPPTVTETVTVPAPATTAVPTTTTTTPSTTAPDAAATPEATPTTPAPDTTPAPTTP